MNTLYRLYVERINLPLLQATVSGYFDGYTLVWSTGFWRGLREQSVIVEVIASNSETDRIKVYDLAVALRIALSQNTVIVTEQSVSVTFVTE